MNTNILFGIALIVLIVLISVLIVLLVSKCTFEGMKNNCYNNYKVVININNKDIIFSAKMNRYDFNKRNPNKIDSYNMINYSGWNGATLLVLDQNLDTGAVILKIGTDFYSNAKMDVLYPSNTLITSNFNSRDGNEVKISFTINKSNFTYPKHKNEYEIIAYDTLCKTHIKYNANFFSGTYLGWNNNMGLPIQIIGSPSEIDIKTYDMCGNSSTLKTYRIKTTQPLAVNTEYKYNTQTFIIKKVRACC